MIPKYENLLKCKGKKFSRPATLGVNPHGNEKKVIVSATADDNNLILGDVQTGGNGIFILYESHKAHYGYADGGISWACSGPYSGCRFQIGTHNGRIYAAHISVEDNVDHSDDLKKILPNAIVKIDYKTSMKDVPVKAMKLLDLNNAAKYIFAWWGGNFNEVSLTEIMVLGMDQKSGDIVSVKDVTPR